MSDIDAFAIAFFVLVMALAATAFAVVNRPRK